MSHSPNLPNKAIACPCCGLKYQCICKDAPQLASQVNIALLTHPNEVKRVTNTGKLLVHSLPNCEVHIWDRVNPPAELLDKIQHQPCYVLFPSEDASEVVQADSISANNDIAPLFIILDSTWQEAKKILNKSPWLAKLPKVKLPASSHSSYSLRRNQAAGNLCTCEVGISLLQQLEPRLDMTPLQQYFELFLNVYEADRNHRVFVVQDNSSFCT